MSGDILLRRERRCGRSPVEEATVRWLKACILGMSALVLSACQGSPAAPARILSLGHHLRETKAGVRSSPAVADLDGDGTLEIAVGSQDGYFYLLDGRLNSLPGWPHYSRGGFYGSPAVADLDGDAEREILAAADAGKLYAWNMDGTSVPGWPVSLGYRAWSSPTVLPDGRIALAGLRQVMVFTVDARPAPGWPQAQPDWSVATAAVGPDLLAVTTLTRGADSGGSLNAWHLDGSPYPWSPLGLVQDSASSPAIADLDRDGALEVVYGDQAGFVRVTGVDGVEREGWPQRTAGAVEASPAVADLDADGRLEVVCGSGDGRMYVWNDAGQLLVGWPQSANGPFVASAALADLDADDAVDIIAGCTDGYLYGWNLRGGALPGFPIYLGASVRSGPWVGDIEGNYRADVIVGADDGIHLLRDVGSLGAVPWPRFHHDLQNSGYQP